MSVSTNTSNYRGVVTGSEVRQIIRESGGDEASAARALRILMERMQFTPEAEAQAMRFLRTYGAEPASCNTQPMTEREALSICLENFNLLDTAAGIGSRDGVIGRADLQAILEAPGASPRLKAAARYLLDRFSRFDDAAGRLGKEDGLIGRIDLEAGIADCDMDPTSAIDVARANLAYLDTAGHGGSPDGLVSRDDLQAAVNDPNAPPEVKAAARYLLNHPELFDLCDTAGYGGDKDGLISADDLNVARELVDLDDASASEHFLETFARFDTAGHGGSPDGLVSRDDLQAIASDPNAPPDMKATARYLLDHPEVFDEMDTAAYGGGKDGLVSRDDLYAYMQAHPSMPAENAPGTGTGTGPKEDDPFGDDFQNQIEEVLTDPTLTVEDQVTLFLMLIAKQMDRQIQRQMEYVNQLQQQQNKAGQNGGAQNGAQNGGSGNPVGPSGQDTSIDVETLKLKRLIDKRGQLFDMLRQIIDKYNQTAKGIIDTIGR